jgi:hypothetical protein
MTRMCLEGEREVSWWGIRSCKSEKRVGVGCGLREKESVGKKSGCWFVCVTQCYHLVSFFDVLIGVLRSHAVAGPAEPSTIRSPGCLFRSLCLASFVSS